VYPLAARVEPSRVPDAALRAYRWGCSLPPSSERSDMTSFDDEHIETGSESEEDTEASSDTDDQDSTDSDSTDADSDSTDADTDSTDPS
jgi:hypothetical protein